MSQPEGPVSVTPIIRLTLLPSCTGSARRGGRNFPHSLSKTKRTPLTTAFPSPPSSPQFPAREQRASHLQLLQTLSILLVFPGQGHTMGIGGEKAAISQSPTPAPAACYDPLWQGFVQLWHYNPSTPPEGLAQDRCSGHRPWPPFSWLPGAGGFVTQFRSGVWFPPIPMLASGKLAGQLHMPSDSLIMDLLAYLISFPGLSNKINKECPSSDKITFMYAHFLLGQVQREKHRSIENQ